MKHTKTIFYVAFLISLLILLNSKTIFANEAQSHVFRTGINLGQVEARLHFLELIYGQRTPPASEFEAIAINLTNAAAHITTAESLFQGIRSPNRDQQTRNVLNRISRYASATNGQNYQRKIAYINGVLGIYRTILAVTYVSSRPDRFQARTTCDSRILDTGYHFGKASYTSLVYSGNSEYRRRVGADSYQQNAYSAMSNVIGDGLRLAVDGYPPGRWSDNAEKVCCTFGTQQSWQNFLKLIRWNSLSSDYANAQYYQVRSITNTNLNPGACGGTSTQNSSCKWRRTTVFGQTKAGYECWCGANKVHNSKCSGTPPGSNPD